MRTPASTLLSVTTKRRGRTFPAFSAPTSPNPVHVVRWIWSLELTDRPCHRHAARDRAIRRFVGESKHETVCALRRNHCSWALSGGLAAGGRSTSTKSSARRASVPRTPRAGRSTSDFETGTLADWTAEGDAFQGQPIEGDTVHRRRGDMRSRHAGRFWVGDYETAGDAPKGTLTSVPFRVTKPFASFLVGGGSRADDVRRAGPQATPDQVVFRASGDDREDMERVVVDLTAHLGKEIVIRLVDATAAAGATSTSTTSGCTTRKPDVPPRRRPTALDVYAHAGLGPEEAARAMTVPPGLQGHALRRRARRRAADRDGDRRPRPALGRRGLLVSAARAARPGARTAS